MLATRYALRASALLALVCALLMLSALGLARLLPLRGGLLYTIVRDPSHIMLVDVDRDISRLYQIGDARWFPAPDGRFARYLPDRPLPELIVKLSTGEERLYQNMGVYGMDWSADSRLLALSWRPQAGEAGLYLLDSTTGTTRLIFSHAEKLYDPRWSPDGTRIAYVRFNEAQRYDLFAYDLQSGQESLLVSTSDDESALTWSPDGQFFAYQRTVNGNAEIFVARTDGTEQRNLTQHMALDSSPSWSSDGRSLAFSSNRAGLFQVYVLDMLTGNLQQVTHGEESALYPVWLR